MHGWSSLLPSLYRHFQSAMTFCTEGAATRHACPMDGQDSWTGPHRSIESSIASARGNDEQAKLFEVLKSQARTLISAKHHEAQYFQR